jgi:hypothetical protein
VHLVTAGNAHRIHRLGFRVIERIDVPRRDMDYMRQLKPTPKAQVRRIKEARGLIAAITRAKMLARA